MENSRKASSLRWRILRQALIPSTPSTNSDEQSETGIKSISRKANQGFSLIPFHLVDNGQPELEQVKPTSLLKPREACVCYTLPNHNATPLFLYQRVDTCANLDDFKICNTYDIDNTGLVCSWPSEEVLAYYCLSQLDLFRSKRVIELGSGYGLAGLLIAAVTEASEVVISDGNPQRNINVNSSVFGGTKVTSMMLHWNQEALDISNRFDIIVASPSEAILFGPKRGKSLDEFLTEVKESGLQFTIDEVYDTEVWRRHERFINSDASWPNYEKDHCYPLLVRITL
ncbi:Nicotinamide N-methyltransferase-like protein [Cynara cardunculus var. scolymus]|uniref:Calmodulin-lysine N-methyltransferase n=1 Tax=Cynara cardunculus var. scolymus TaxID=59895 RepID=A0A103YGP6_CYNCS|nr:Nicotinamide N-methyltransferase-like protein [Cynara cardunculus var. scolymus]